MFDGMDYVYEVYLERSFSGAAKKLFISQPALSASVKKVEKQLGVTIFDRSTNPISLTPAGKVCIESIEKMRTLEHGMLNQLNDLSDMKSGSVTVSGENFISSFILPKIIINFMKKYGGIKVETVESNTHDLKNQLLDEKVDILVAHDFDPALFVSFPLADETLMLAVPSEYEINKKYKSCALTDDDIVCGKYMRDDCPTVDLKKFSGEPFLILKRGNDMFTRSMTLCDSAGFVPDVKIYPDQLLTAYNMCKAGLGVTIVTDNLVSSVSGGGKCVFYKISGTNTHRKLAIAYKKRRYPSRATKAFVNCALEMYEK